MNLCPIVPYGDPSLGKWMNRRPVFDPDLAKTVADIIVDVEKRGAQAVLEQTQRFSSPEVSNLIVRPAEQKFDDVLSSEHQDAIITAIERVTDFHQIEIETLTEGWTKLAHGWGWRTYSHERDNEESGMIGQRLLPVRSAGIYVPGGNAEYPSSVVMNVVPAIVAGVRRIVVATPPRSDGTVSPAVLFACDKLDVEAVLLAGGASAVAAMALGIDGVQRVDVVAGPGNRYVNEAKRQLWGAVGLDFYAGPSEVCVVADDSAHPKLAAADLLCQVEHAPDNVAVLVALSHAVAEAVLHSANDLLAFADRRDVMRSALSDNGVAIVCADEKEACRAVDGFAPEHLALHVGNPLHYLDNIHNFGAAMMGPWTPQSVADYCEGPSHTLPTSGAARFTGALSVSTFLRSQSVSMLEEEDAKDLVSTAKAFAEMEGLAMHGQDATLRNEEP